MTLAPAASNPPRNLRRPAAGLITAGQPDADALAGFAAEGVGTVINLALHDQPYALPDERATVAGLGMRYAHIPVDFAAPTPADWHAFADAFATARAEGRPVLVHCAANWRVTIFYALWQIKREGRAPAEALAALDGLWTPDAAWSAFIATMLEPPGRGP